MASPKRRPRAGSRPAPLGAAAQQLGLEAVRGRRDRRAWDLADAAEIAVMDMALPKMHAPLVSGRDMVRTAGGDDAGETSHGRAYPFRNERGILLLSPNSCGLAIVPTEPTAAILDAAIKEAHAESALGVWSAMTGAVSLSEGENTG